MKFEEVLKQLESLGTEQNRKIFARHGCDISQFGVSIANLKKVLKPIKKDTDLGYKLFMSNNADAMYLSQWIVDTEKLTIPVIEKQILGSNYYLLIENAIPHILAKQFDKAMVCVTRWLHHEEQRFRQTAYSLLGLLVSIYDDNLFDMELIRNELQHIQNNIHQEENRVRYVMNNFVIAIGAYIPALTIEAKSTAKAIGVVDVYMGETSCKVPHAYTYIEHIESLGRVGQKRKL